jgi:hypothetical protein
MIEMTTTSRDARLRSLTDRVAYFDPSNPVHLAHYNALKVEFGEMAAAMLVSQDAAYAVELPEWTRGAPKEGDRIRSHATGNVKEWRNGSWSYVHAGLELTDPGQIASHPGWKARNRVVRHGEVARYTIFDFDADTKAGGRLVPMFVREQTVPAYAQPE